MKQLGAYLAAVAFGVMGLWAAPLLAQDAAALHKSGQAEGNPVKSVQLLCQAADLAPTNQAYRNDCNTSKASVLAGDQRLLKNAQEEFEAGYKPKARRDARNVTSLDPSLYKQAQDLIANIDGGGAPVNGNANDAQKALLAQAKAAAQGITDPALKNSANQVLANIEHLNGGGNTGTYHEEPKETAANNPPADPRKRDTDPRLTVNQKVSKPPVAEVSPEEKKKRLLADATSALKGNDLDTAGRKFKQLLDLDPSSAEARDRLRDITAALNKDPAQLEQMLRNAIVAYYGSHFEDAESRFNRYLGAATGKRKGAAYFYLGATEATLAMLDDASKRPLRTQQAKEDFKQAREAGYQPIETLVSSRVLGVWKSSGM